MFFCPQAIQVSEQLGDAFAGERRSKCFSVNLAVAAGSLGFRVRNDLFMVVVVVFLVKKMWL